MSSGTRAKYKDAGVGRLDYLTGETPQAAMVVGLANQAFANALKIFEGTNYVWNKQRTLENLKTGLPGELRRYRKATLEQWLLMASRKAILYQENEKARKRAEARGEVVSLPGKDNYVGFYH